MKAGDLVVTSFPEISPFTETRDLQERLASEKFFVVMDTEGFQGIVTVADYLRRPHKLIIDCVEDKPKINFDDDLSQAMLTLKESGHSALPVFKGDEFYGVFSEEAVFNFASEIILQGLCESTNEESVRATRILAAGLGHDFNNLLTVILGGITISLRQEIKSQEQTIALQKAERAAVAAKKLSRQLLLFSREEAPKKETVDLAKLIAESVSFYTLNSGVTTKFHFETDTLPVHANIDQLNQIFSNLTVNAIQAMPEGGEIFFRLRQVAITEDSDLPLHAGKYNCIEVEDTGTGIPKKYLHKIFDPNFTTKPKGSGLGLAISYSVITKHDGHITVESEKGKGTKFTIYLPTADSCQAQEVLEETSFTRIENQSKQKNFLVMDDNLDNLELLERYLTHLGHRVKTANSSKKTLRLYKEALKGEDPFDAALLDLILPGDAGGEEVMRALLNLDAEAKGIITSGYGGHEIMVNHQEYGFSGSITKPYRLSELRAMLEEI